MLKDLTLLNGVVLNGAHGIYDIHTDQGIFRCTLRGKLKKAFAQAQASKSATKKRPRYDHILAGKPAPYQAPAEDAPLTSRLSVGDHVRLRPLDAETGLIEEILPRQNALVRKDAGSTPNKAIQQTLLANLDQVVIVLAVAQPEPHFGFLDRFLIICESTELQVTICLNKADLEYSDEVQKAANLYSSLGYRVIWTSTLEERGLTELRALLKDHTTIFTGPSGVGKSSLVNALEPEAAIRTGMVSDLTGKGRHTTTGSQLYPLSSGGWLADSAGIRALAAWNIEPEELAHCFIEFRPFLGSCEYVDCAHLDEEGCAILEAVQSGQISDQRYRSYTRIHSGEER